MKGATGLTVMLTRREKELVEKIARKVFKKFCPAGPGGQIEFDDLVHLGIIGLLEAKKRYDEKRGIPFFVFASVRIRGAMLDQIRMQPIVRTSQEFARKFNSLKKVRESLLRKGEVPEDEKLAEKLGWTLEEVQKVSGQAVHMIQAKETVQNENGGQLEKRGEIIRESGPGSEKLLLRKELATSIRTCLENLPFDEFRMVLLARVLEDIKLKELADAMGCSIQTVANRQEAARLLMKDCLERQGWSPKEFSQLFG